VEEIYIPQPVIRLIHEAAAAEVEEMEVIDDQILGSQFEAEVIIEAITDDTEVVESESQSEAEERVEAITDDTEAVEEDEADSLAEEDEPDDMDEGEELGTEYVQFEDDWLPFDDD
jgi:hypothetical protein